MNFKDLFFKNSKITDDHKEFIVITHMPLMMATFSNLFLLKKTLKKTKEINLAGNKALVNFHLSTFLNPITPKGKLLLSKTIDAAKNLNVNLTFESNPKLPKILPDATSHPGAFAKFCLENNLKMTVDVSHLATFNTDIVSFFKKYHKQIALIHLSDFKDKKQHLPLFTGDLPLREFLTTLKQVKWNGIIAFEIFKFGKKNKMEKFKILENNLKEVRKILK